MVKRLFYKNAFFGLQFLRLGEHFGFVALIHFRQAFEQIARRQRVFLYFLHIAAQGALVHLTHFV
jgi:hypothetical protein